MLVPQPITLGSCRQRSLQRLKDFAYLLAVYTTFVDSSVRLRGEELEAFQQKVVETNEFRIVVSEFIRGRRARTACKRPSSNRFESCRLAGSPLFDLISYLVYHLASVFAFRGALR